ncbi:RNA-binding protein [Sporobacter termitidis DSM 10068]|uniref:RNA-binding protein n=1 Tax=Sporobacter termitidis DSM 10068 TaxID=1123282 RepID=A0A1M5UKR6_9FIRM|nr:YhbY family RNA-binding protein [Sporobacter termitidis]SHH63436.1 RNA-binding protein [Sporobacter termitidis DSM 10068]
MLNSRQRAQLRAMANALDTILQIGKGGITENVVAQVSDALAARELIKGRVLESSMLSSQEAADELARLCRAESVQTIGSRFVLYKENHEIPKEKRIRLVK